MAKSVQLTELANELAGKFFGFYNNEYIELMENQLKQLRKKSVKIDILNENIIPRKLKNNEFEGIIGYYKRWFLHELKRLGIPKSKVKKTIITIEYQQKEDLKRLIEVTINSEGDIYKWSSKIFL